MYIHIKLYFPDKHRRLKPIVNFIFRVNDNHRLFAKNTLLMALFLCVDYVVSCARIFFRACIFLSKHGFKKKNENSELYIKVLADSEETLHAALFEVRTL